MQGWKKRDWNVKENERCYAGLPWIWISMDIPMGIMLEHLLIKLTISFSRLFMLVSQTNN